MSDSIVRPHRKVDIQRHLNNDFEILQLKKEIEEIERHVEQQDKLQEMQPLIQNGELVIRDPLPRGLVGFRLDEIRSLQIIGQRFTFEYYSQIGSLYFLKDLVITRCSGVSDLLFLQSLHQLKRLSVTDSGLSNVDGLQSLKWIEEINLSSNPLSSLKPIGEGNQWRSSIDLLDLSGTQLSNLSELSVLKKLSCQIETLNISETPIDQNDNRSVLERFFSDCKCVSFIQISRGVISTNELLQQSSEQALDQVGEWTVRSYGLPPELEVQSTCEAPNNQLITSQANGPLDIETLQNCSEAEFDRLLKAQTMLQSTQNPQEDLQSIVRQQQKQIAGLTEENRLIRDQLKKMQATIDSLASVVSKLQQQD